jgi:hypothetical protein
MTRAVQNWTKRQRAKEVPCLAAHTSKAGHWHTWLVDVVHEDGMRREHLRIALSTIRKKLEIANLRGQ